MNLNKLSKEKQKNVFSKILEVFKTMASKPSGFIGLFILVFHVLLAILIDVLKMLPLPGGRPSFFWQPSFF